MIGGKVDTLRNQRETISRLCLELVGTYWYYDVLIHVTSTWLFGLTPEYCMKLNHRLLNSFKLHIVLLFEFTPCYVVIERVE